MISYTYSSLMMILNMFCGPFLMTNPLDWMASLVYKATWSIVGNDVCQAAHEFFRTGR